MRIRRIILLFGVVNACLFCGLLPLWEGFDEAFHYGYVETLWQAHQLPVLGKTMIPADVSKSFLFTPMSHVVQRWTPEATNYDDWFALTIAEKEQRRNELNLLRPEAGDSSRPNYEAHHPPLAYLMLALFDWPMSNAPITVRVLVLRLVAAVIATVMLYRGATALCGALQMTEQSTNATLLTIFCSEMLYATIAHVSNDWLAVGLSALFLSFLARFVHFPERRMAVWTAFWLAAGLLSKAYFLVFALLAVATTGIMIWRKRVKLNMVIAGGVLVLTLAGPWYVRNLVLYKNVSGTHEEFDGIGIKQALAAAPRILWVETSGFLARGSLWTGNNSFTTFSRSTLNIVLMLLFLGLVSWGFSKRVIQPVDYFIFGGIVLFSAAVGYATCASFAHTNGETAGASPWYTQVLLAPVVALSYLGYSRWRRGPILAACSVAIWTWVLIATWTIKLFPMYSGGSNTPMRLQDVWNWYTQGMRAHMQELDLVALAPAYLLYAGMIASIALSILLSAAVIRDLIAESPAQPC